MTIEIWAVLIALVSALISLFSVYFARKTLEANVCVCRNATLVTYTATNEQKLLSTPKLLELYGIDESSLRSDGMEPTELLYIWCDLRQGEIYHRMDDFKNPETFITDYRGNFLKNNKVRLAFNKYIYRKLMTDSPYITKVKEYLDANP